MSLVELDKHLPLREGRLREMCVAGHLLPVAAYLLSSWNWAKYLLACYSPLTTGKRVDRGAAADETAITLLRQARRSISSVSSESRANDGIGITKVLPGKVEHALRAPEKSETPMGFHL
jgi:hypothetical protein